MFRHLLKVISLKNLYGSSEKGQITTLLLLMIVGVLAFVLVTANLGNVSTVTTNLSNAADSAALYLASQLATRSNQLWEELDRETEKCKKGGMLSLILAIVIAIIAVVVTIFTAGAAAPAMFAMQHMVMLMIIGAIAGAVGGAAGAAIQGTSILTGALMGAVVGAAIGACASAVGTAVYAAAPASTASATSTAVAVNAGVDAVTMAAPTVVAPTMSMQTAIGSATLSALGVGAKVYNEYVTQEMTFDAIRAGIKSINGLLEYDRYRESVFYQALSQTIDDSNKTDSDYVRLWYDDDGDGELEEGENRHCRSKDSGNCDPWDSDGDGDKKEAVPYFQYWWDLRVRALKSIIPELEALTYLFLWGEASEGYNTAWYREPYNPSLSKPNECEHTYEHSFQNYAVTQYSETYACTADTFGGSSVSSSLCSGYYSADGGGYAYNPVWSSGLLYRTDVGTDSTEWKRYIKCPSEYSAYYGEGTSCKTNMTVNSAETDKILVPVVDGVVIQVGKALEYKGIKVSFYEPGLTTRSDYDGDEKDGKEGCPKKKDKDGNVVKDKNGKTVYECDGEDYIDEAEVVVATLIDFKEAVKALKAQSIDRLTSTWQTWVRTFYDMGVKERDEETCEITYKKESKGNFSDQFDIIINGEDLDGNGETGEEDVDVPVDSDNDGDTDSYEVKDEFKGLKAWKKEIKEGKKKLKNKINACGDIGYLDDDGACNDYCYGRYGDGSGCTTCYKDVPCILDSGGITTDSDADDEFEEALTAIDGLISNLESFQKSAKNYYNDMDAVYEKMNEKYGADFDFGGINPVTYRWTDSRCMGGKDFEEDAEGNPDMTKICGQDTGDNDGDGDKDEPDPACPRMDTCDQDADGITEELYKCHSITVEVSQFKVPWVDNEESGGFLSKKSCAGLTDYCYNPNNDSSWKCENSYNPLWVKITRRDLGNQMVGSIAKWNPKGDGGDDVVCSKDSSDDADISQACKVWKEANPELKISRSATPYFSYNKVGLASAGKKKAESK